MQVWRLYPERFRETAFTGAGGLYVASRWNHLGTAMVYTATSPALAALEFFVNLEPNEAPDDLLSAAALWWVSSSSSWGTDVREPPGETGGRMLARVASGRRSASMVATVCQTVGWGSMARGSVTRM